MSSFSENVSFSGTSGTLELARSQAFTGAISGFAQTGATALDLRDVGFVNAGEATFSGTATGGVLTVSDGTHTASVTLQGDYTDASWTASSDGGGGVTVVATPTPQAPSPYAFVAAMAAVEGPSASSDLQTAGNWSPRPIFLTTPHADAV